MTHGHQWVMRIDELLDAGRSVMLVGEVGVGKSHTARLVADKRVDDHLEVLHGAPAIQAIPFGAAADLIRPTRL